MQRAKTYRDIITTGKGLYEASHILMQVIFDNRGDDYSEREYFMTNGLKSEKGCGRQRRRKRQGEK